MNSNLELSNFIYRKSCVMPNQRPSTHPKFTKSKTSDAPTFHFGNDGICDACNYNKQKKLINLVSASTGA